MGGTKATSVPYPTFDKAAPSSGEALPAVGRCRINPLTCTSGDEFNAIFEKNVQQANVDDKAEDPGVKAENKKLKKKYMKQGVAMAQSFLSDTLNLDTSIVDIEILIDASTIIQSDGCIAACFLDAGCDRIAFDGNTDKETLLKAMDVARIPKERVIVHFDEIKEDSIISEIANFAAAVSMKFSNNPSAEKCIEISNSIFNASKGLGVAIQIPSATVDTDPELVSTLSKYFYEKDTPVGAMSLLDPSPKQLGLSYASCIRTDRPDGLYATVVCTRSNEALGLVYSSKESVIAALECGRGVYYSRSRNGLWRKGDTSGHYQILHRIDVDCDGDALRFTVTQRGEPCAFCHLNTLTCWGEATGLRHLEQTLQARLKSAPEGSYTKRLFDDSELLRDKLVEEAQELSEAESKQHVAEELADVLYFAMVKAAKAGVSIDDAVGELDRRSRKVTRRKGDSKSFRIEAGNKILNK